MYDQDTEKAYALAKDIITDLDNVNGKQDVINLLTALGGQSALQIQVIIDALNSN